ncbi:MAG TPA: GNAT family N-acetyltransferase [Chitinophagaceae bacterium]|nr:GNAT family N-acetyltransferase [Chitinophagaceae bacterium]
MQLSIQQVTKDRWADLERLFGKQGACNGCWCMYWRIGAEYHKRDRSQNKADLRRIISSNHPSGLLAFVDDVPVAWCQLTPRNDLSWLIKSGFGNFNAGSNAWCISCFYIKHGYRRKGITLALIKASIDHAKKAGADLLEAYPRTSRDPFTGHRSTFLKAGFKIAAEAKYGTSIAFIKFKKNNSSAIGYNNKSHTEKFDT